MAFVTPVVEHWLERKNLYWDDLHHWEAELQEIWSIVWERQRTNIEPERMYRFSFIHEQNIIQQCTNTWAALDDHYTNEFVACTICAALLNYLTHSDISSSFNTFYQQSKQYINHRLHYLVINVEPAEISCFSRSSVTMSQRSLKHKHSCTYYGILATHVNNTSNHSWNSCLIQCVAYKPHLQL